jgi:2-polyprenyl-3-methyl-5-hydroxy-6-metoxy-1,4-benzoquinol methylase/glycosyltransferase involved in cell wall biosynthesis
MRYQSVIDPNNKNNSHSLTIDFVAEATGGESLDILDVGCSAGYLGEYLRAQGHHVTGIDITPEAIEKAAEFLNEAHCMKVEDFFAAHPERRFDVVIFGDVLEHVTNAEEVLKLTAQALKPRGRVIASIPNVSHLAVRAMLLEGRWEYANLGLLDRDHVRFFTRKTIEQLFHDSGFDAVDMRTTNLPVETVDEMCGMQLNPTFVHLAKKAAGDDNSATVFQYVAMAQLQSDVPRVVCLVPDLKSGLFNFRVKTPLDNWARRHNGAVRYRLLGEHRPEDLVWGDVFVFERMGGTHTLRMINLLKQYGKRVVFEIDDLLTELPDFLAHHRGSPETQLSLRNAITQADLVTTTTPRLAARLATLNPQVVCVPNCIKDMPPARAAHGNALAPKVTLIIASSDTVLVDYLIAPLKHIQAKYGDQIKVVVVGPIDKALKKGGIQFERAPILTYPKFVELLQTLVNPIGLIPLDNSIFSSCKSPIKYFDYASASIPAICSNVPPYSDYVVHEQTGLLVENTNEAWISAIESLIQSTGTRQALAQAARAYVIATHLADQAGDAWQTAIQTLKIDQSPQDAVAVAALVEASVLVIKPNINVLLIARRLTQLRTYSRLVSILKNEGVAGVKKRLMRW